MQQDELFIVSVDQNGRIYINKGGNPQRPMSLGEFRQLAPGMLAQEPTRQAYVKGDQNVMYGRVVEVMVALQNAGVPSVGLISQPESNIQTN